MRRLPGTGLYCPADKDHDTVLVSARLDKISISQQLALLTAGLCLLVSFALVGLAAVSGQHLQLKQQDQFGSALAEQLARRISSTLETGNLLGLTASLQRFVASTAAEEIAVFDVEGKVIGQAGDAAGAHLANYRSDVRIENDIAGEVLITLSSAEIRETQRRLLLSLCGLALLLGIAVFGITRYLSKGLAKRLKRLTQAVMLEDAAAPDSAVNELARLEHHIKSLPIDLLRTRSSSEPTEDSYHNTAVLYVHLTSLSNYVDTLDHDTLLAYTQRLHRAIYAAAGFYGGQLQVVRQFGLVLYFCGAVGDGANTATAGSPAFRAAACAWLIKAVCSALEKDRSLSMTVAVAVEQSELGAGSEGDIYPGLYMQHTLDNLQSICGSQPPKVLLSPTVCDDPDIESRLVQHTTELQDYGALDEFIAPYRDLLERQLMLIVRRLGEGQSQGSVREPTA